MRAYCPVQLAGGRAVTLNLMKINPLIVGANIVRPNEMNGNGFKRTVEDVCPYNGITPE